jgi:hypothetical protein
MVERKIPPMAMGPDNEILVELFPNANDQMKEATQDIVEAIKLLQETKAQIITLEDTKDELTAKLKQVIGHTHQSLSISRGKEVQLPKNHNQLKKRKIIQNK